MYQIPKVKTLSLFAIGRGVVVESSGILWKRNFYRNTKTYQDFGFRKKFFSKILYLGDTGQFVCTFSKI